MTCNDIKVSKKYIFHKNPQTQTNGMILQQRLIFIIDPREARNVKQKKCVEIIEKKLQANKWR